MMDILAALAEEAAKAELAKELGPEASALQGMAASTTPMPESNGMLAASVDASPMSFGQQMGNVATNAINQQMAPSQGLFKTVIDPKSTMGDIGRSAFEYSVKTKEDTDAAPKMGQYSNPYINMANNTVGGIPSLLQDTKSGLLPFFGAR